MSLPAQHRLALILKTALALALGLMLAACAAMPGPIEGDRDPHRGVARAHGMAVQGIDVSRHQGAIDWDATRRGGTRFVFMKATEGKDHMDPNFYANWRGARDAGIPRAAYHFMTWCSTAAEQAAWFRQIVPNDPDALPPVLDLEWNNHSSCKNRFGRADVLEKVRVMLAAMEAHTGKLPIIYTDMTFHRDILEGEYFDNPFWLRSVAAEPRERYNGRVFTFWQYTQTGRVAGVRGDVDRNVFYGSEGEWVNFLLTGCDPRALRVLQPQGRCQSAK